MTVYAVDVAYLAGSYTVTDSPRVNPAWSAGGSQLVTAAEGPPVPQQNGATRTVQVTLPAGATLLGSPRLLEQQGPVLLFERHDDRIAGDGAGHTLAQIVFEV